MISISPDDPPRFLDGEETLSLPEGLKRLRAERCWSTNEMGEMLGVSHRTIQNWEMGRREMPLTALLLLRCLFQPNREKL